MKEIPVVETTIATRAEEPRSVGDMLRLALDKGATVETLEKLVGLHERVQARQAASEFADALARFQRKCGPVPKRAKAHITTKSGVRYSYSYAELSDIAEHIREPLHALGLSYTWDSTVDQGKVRAICTLRHVNGHSISATFEAPVDATAHMNDTQKVGSALQYAKRGSLTQVLGLTTADPDDDGGGGAESITDQQAADLVALMEEVAADKARFLRYLKVDRIEQLLARDYASAVAALEQKRRKP